MVYSNQFVAAIKVGGKILRENHGTVAVPFGAEYSVLLKNLSSVRALVTVSVDGVAATESTQLIVAPNGSIDLERFIKNGNLQRGNRFKFIKRTAAIEEHRGIAASDGLVRVEYKFESVPAPQPLFYGYDYYNWPHWYSRPYYGILRGAQGGNFNTVQTAGVLNNSGTVVMDFAGDATYTTTTTGTGVSDKAQASCNYSEASVMRCAEPVEEHGITVPGSVSLQEYQYGEYFPTESTAHVIVLKLVGQVSGKPVRKAVTAKAKIKCSTCGTSNKGSHQYCKDCGTALKPI